MPFDPHLAAIRFGLGLSPVQDPPASVADMMALLRGPDEAGLAFPIPGYADVEPSAADFGRAIRAARRADDPVAAVAAERDAMQALVGSAWAGQLGHAMARLVASPDALRERLALFWADHFTVVAKKPAGRHLVYPFAEDVVRPHLAGRFGDMLVAATTHPVMLDYLDGRLSVGPDSPGAEEGEGLNENLARELLELHTLGAGGPYGQADVREMAELLTGLRYDGDALTVFRPRYAQPGAETVLGQSYDGGQEAIEAALRDLAVHPATADHLARKLAVHFVADDPPPALVADLAATWRDTEGDLGAVTEALLSHEEAWSPVKAKVKPPIEFVASALRALAVPPEALTSLDLPGLRRLLLGPLALMGQPWTQPAGPDGWPEAAGAWVTPAFVAARIDWAMNRPEEIADLPDPRDFVAAALGPAAAPEVVAAARAAERPHEGVGVVLASADFQRR